MHAIGNGGNMDNVRINKQFDFIREIDKEKKIIRQNYLSDGVTRENDAEHAWHMAMMAILLSEYSEEPIDVLKTVTMILAHDLVEIEAGDTFAFDEQAKLSQRERELEAAEHIVSMLPEDQGAKFRALWDEFEEGKTAEAKFANAMDRTQPLVLHGANGGKMWSEKGVSLAQVKKRASAIASASQELYDFAYENIIAPNVASGKIKE